MKRNSFLFFYSFILLFFSGTVAAQTTSIKEVFKTMPDSLIPYLSQNNKLDFIDFMESNMEAKVTNSLNGTSRMETMNDQFLSLTLNEASKMQMRLLPVSEPVDSMQQIICVVRTLGTKGQESTISFYSCSWRPLDLSIKGLVSVDDVLVRPESMSAEHFQELKTILLPYMYWAELSDVDDTLTMGISYSDVPADDLEEIKAIRRLMTLKWDGKIFKKD